MTYFNYGEPGHISTQCHKPNKAQSSGKVFALSGTETTRYDNLIKGTCSLNGIPLITIVDTGVTHLFISLDYAKKLNMEISHMVGSMVVDTLTNG